ASSGTSSAELSSCAMAFSAIPRTSTSAATAAPASKTTKISSTHGHARRRRGASSTGGAGVALMSHPFGGRDAEQAEAVAQHLTCRVVEGEPGAMHGLDRFVAERDHATRTVPAVIRAGELLEVARDPVRLAQLDRLQGDAGELGERAEQLALGLMCEQRRVEALAGDPRGRGIAGDGARARLGVLHV